MNERGNTPRLRGWLALFAVVLVAFFVLNGQALIDSAFNQTNSLYPIEYRSDRIASIHALASVATILRLLLLLAGAYIVWLLHCRDRRLPRIFAIYGACYVLFEVSSRAQYFYMGGFMDEGSTVIYWVMTGLRVGLVGLGYVSLLRWSKATQSAVATVPGAGARGIAHAGPVPNGVARRAFWIGSAMVVWPFAVGLFIDPDFLVAALLSPTAVTAGYGLALAIQVVSVVVGLLVVMKLAFQMRVRWILVLLPICCGALFVLHVSISFLHWTF